jgi:diadenosine tetraphosphate (Ap4A) HIT family hydrolase
MSAGDVLPDATPCPICAENEAADNGDDPWFIARLSTGYVRLMPTQYFRGGVFFAAKSCVRELHDLPRPDRQAHLLEMTDVAEAVFAGFGAHKMNYEALGNGVPHARWWLTPQHPDDRHPRGPIWENLDFPRELWTGGMRPEGPERTALKEQVFSSLDGLGLAIERRFTA